MVHVDLHVLAHLAGVRHRAAGLHWKIVNRGGQNPLVPAVWLPDAKFGSDQTRIHAALEDLVAVLLSWIPKIQRAIT